MTAKTASRVAAPKGRASAADAGTPNHRARTGAARRQQTRGRLLTAALSVFATAGSEAPPIEEFIAAAGVARGTFYNYFNTTQELLDAVTSDLSDQILAAIDAVVLPIEDPLRRMTCGALLYMNVSVELPSWGAFMLRSGLRSEATGKLVDVYLPRDLGEAQQRGLVKFPSLRAARDFVHACANQAVQTVLSGAAPRTHLQQMWGLTLRGLGVAPAEIARLCAMPLPAVVLPEGLMPRGESR